MHSRRHRPAAPSAPPARGPVAPVYRGPQATPYHAHGGGVPTHAPNAALLIDFDNVTMGIRSDLQTELKNLLSSDIVKGKVSVQRAYADWRRYPQYIVPLSEASIDLIFAPAYGSSKKNATDIRLAIDALELVFTRPEIGSFILLSGDSDFSSLVIKLKEYGKYVIGVGIRESSSDLLVQNCDEYYSYNALAGLVKYGDEETVKWDPWELVGEAVKRMKQNGDVMRADRLKQVMQQIDSNFDEGNVGMAKFSRFVTEAAQRGLLSLKKLENGQIEIDEPHVDVVPAAAATAAPSSVAKEEPNGRRRKGRGGRGRAKSERSDRAGKESKEPQAAQQPATDIARKLDAAAAAHPASAQAAPAQAQPARAFPTLAGGLRGRTLSRRGFRGGGRDAGPPPELLSVGVVDFAPARTAVSDNGARAGQPAAKTRSRTRMRPARKKQTDAAQPTARAEGGASERKSRTRRGTRKKKATVSPPAAEPTG
jgi:uncharacterized protein (TIGR00288 family)